MASVDDFNWDDLRYFLRAAQTKTLAGAARSMGVEHTTIGRRLSALERALGAPLVLRGPEGLTLTPLGQRIAPLVQDVERAVSATRAAVKSECARVRLSVPQALTGLFMQALAQLRRDHPESHWKSSATTGRPTSSGARSIWQSWSGPPSTKILSGARSAKLVGPCMRRTPISRAERNPSTRTTCRGMRLSP